MPLQFESFAIISEANERVPSNGQTPGDKVAEKLQSQLINAFEGAIYQGMQPMDALVVILSWMSSEMIRIQADQTKRASL
jgi:hypothetical protein